MRRIPWTGDAMAYAKAHVAPKSWQCVAWASTSSAKSRAKERIWFSPHCLDAVAQRDLFEGLEAS